MTVWTYIIYLGISVAMTVWVAQTLFKHGRIFLVETFSGKEELADSVNHLLVVGFYLINIGYVTLALQYGAKPVDLTGAIEALSTKVGLVLLVLGFMHFFNLAVFSKMRKRGLHRLSHGADSGRTSMVNVASPAGGNDALDASGPENTRSEPL